MGWDKRRTEFPRGLSITSSVSWTKWLMCIGCVPPLHTFSTWRKELTRAEGGVKAFRPGGERVWWEEKAARGRYTRKLSASSGWLGRGGVKWGMKTWSERDWDRKVDGLQPELQIVEAEQ